MEKFFESQNIPKHIGNLLELCGVSCIADIAELCEDDLNDFEQLVRQDLLKNQVDLTTPKSRIKYFGIDLLDIAEFSFRPFDRKKLLKLPLAAKSKLEADGMRKTEK